MGSQKLERTTYRDPFSPGMPPREGEATNADLARDMDQFARPLEQVHAGATLHGWGVAAGLQVRATLNGRGVRVLPGVALDVNGRHISLAQDGLAELGQNADASGAVPVLAGVTSTGVIVPTDGLTGQKYLTIEFRETFDSDAFSTHSIFRYLHTPWLRLLDATGFIDDGTRLVLARLTFGSGGASGNVTAIVEGLRRGVDVPTESIHLTRSRVASHTVEQTPAGEIRSRPAGGLQIQTANAADEILITGPNARCKALDVNAGVLRLHGTEIQSATASEEIRVTGPGTALPALDVNAAVLRLHDTDIQAADVADDIHIGGPGRALCNALHIDAASVRIHGTDLMLDGRSGAHQFRRALVDATDRLIVNFGGDYPQGVDVNLLHLSDHIKVSFWEQDENLGWQPPDENWWTFYELDTGLPDSEWTALTFCEIGMQTEYVPTSRLYWATLNRSYISGAGTIVIRWILSATRNWWPSNRKVFWLAFRR